MAPADKAQLQRDIYAAHEEAQRDDAERRAVNRLQVAHWDAVGGDKAQAEHFDFLRTLPKQRLEAI